MPHPRRVEQHALRRVAVAPRPPGLLVVGLDRLRHVQMNHAPHVGLVDAHPERDRRTDHRHLVARELVLHLLAQRARQTRVIRLRRNPRIAQTLRRGLRVHPPQRVDDRRRLRIARQQPHQPFGRLLLRHHPIRQVGPVVARTELADARPPELLHDVRRHPIRRRRRQRRHRRIRETTRQLRELPVVGPKLVPPLRDAVRLIDRDQLRRRRVHQVREALRVDPLGSHVEQPGLPAPHPHLNLKRLLRRQRAVQKIRRRPVRPQRPHLVLHQRDQRRHHQRQPLPQQRRQLVAERLPPARRHQHQRILAAAQVLNHLPLQRPKLPKPKEPLESVEQWVSHQQATQRSDAQSVRRPAARRSICAPELTHAGASDISAAHRLVGDVPRRAVPPPRPALTAPPRSSPTRNPCSGESAGPGRSRESDPDDP